MPYPGDSGIIRESWHIIIHCMRMTVLKQVLHHIFGELFTSDQHQKETQHLHGNASLELNVHHKNNLYTCIPSVTALAMRLCLLTIRLSSYREGEIQGWFLLQILLFKNKTVL